MHSSRMRTVRNSSRLLGVSALREVSVPGSLLPGVLVPGEGAAPRGVSALGECLVPGGVPGPGGGWYPSMH